MAKPKKKRIRRLPPLDSEEGRLSVERTRQYLAKTLGTAYTKPEFVGTPVEHLQWMMVMPGFVEARQSAFDAWMQSEAELPFWREVAQAPDEAARAEIVARHRTNLSLGAPEDVAAGLFKHVSKAQAYRILAEASKNAETGKPRPEFAYDFVQHAAEDIPEDVRSSEELAESWTLLAGRRSSAMRRLLIVCWVRGGLWLMETPDIAAFLITRKAGLPEMNSLPEPAAETVRVWKSDLGLKSYAGKGHLKYNQAGMPKLDMILTSEVESALQSLQDHLDGKATGLTSSQVQEILCP